MNKAILCKYEALLSRIYRSFYNFGLKKIGKTNKVVYESTFAKHVKFEIDGRHNEILFLEGGLTRINNCKFVIRGSYNKIIIHKHVVIDDCTFWIEDDNNTIEIGADTWINPNCGIACIEGTSVIIGKGCMFSSNIDIRTGDSHGIIDAATGYRINHSMDIKIGNHVWLGWGATVLKGTEIGEHSIVSTRALLANKSYPSYSVVAGVPGVVKRSGVSWEMSRQIPFE